MAYRCRSCTHTGGVFPGGACPGCGSFNIVRVADPPPKPPLARKPYRLILAVALWLYLVMEIARKIT
jgi:hypothetical protein